MQIFPYAEHIKSKYNIYFLTKNGCFVTPSYINPKWGCSNIQDYKALIENVHFDKIVTSIYNINGYLSDDLELQKKQIAQRTQEYDDFLAFAKQYADKVYMLLGEPKGDEFDPKVSIRYKLRTRVPIEEIRALYETHYQALNQLESLDGVNIIDPLDYLCDTHCDVMDSNAGFYYRDSNHMRPGYAIQALHYLEPVFME